MSMSHKAFVFDWAGFIRELGPALSIALRHGAIEPLSAFIEQHTDDVCDPYDGDPIPSDWRQVLGNAEVQELGDYALTKYYSPIDDFGLGGNWLKLSNNLADFQQRALLGEPYGDAEHLFDPGRMGSYFQSPAQVVESLRQLQALRDARLSGFVHGLSNAVNTGKGIYVTF